MAGVEALAGFVAFLPAEATTTPPDESGALSVLTPAGLNVVLDGMGLEAAEATPKGRFAPLTAKRPRRRRSASGSSRLVGCCLKVRFQPQPWACGREDQSVALLTTTRLSPFLAFIFYLRAQPVFICILCYFQRRCSHLLMGGNALNHFAVSVS